MEGRWAQLATDAHIAHAIDYSRPVKPFIEELVFQQLELKRALQVCSLYPLVTDGELRYLRSAWVDKYLAEALLPWEQETEEQPTPTQDLHNKINELEQLRSTNAR